KFGVQIPLEDVTDAQREDAGRILLEKMQAAYRAREIEYPPHFAVGVALQAAGSNHNQVCTLIAQWAGLKYGRKWDFEHFLAKEPPQIYEELRGLQEEFLANGALEAQIDEAIAAQANNGILDWATKRFGKVVEKRGLREGPDLREGLIGCGRDLLCRELRELERYILLQIYDSVWKDHMYSMDLLRSGIGLRGYAEKDPKIEYKREGTRLFSEMLENMRERVTDLVFRAQITGGGGGGGDGTEGLTGGGIDAAPTGGPGPMTTSHADATNAGFSSAAADHDAAMAKQGEGGKAETIRRSMPRVGRNAPCPCGSGKKYKQCHGKQG
ncbi:MAG: SEC-C domain-containing protein, partial [Planctomycetes bacterium]|nr:SEC-C domain-containing protein [Planctomycetota bacterium]